MTKKTSTIKEYEMLMGNTRRWLDNSSYTLTSEDLKSMERALEEAKAGKLCDSPFYERAHLESSTLDRGLIDFSKPCLSLIPQSSVLAATEAFQDGVKKHGGMYNWRTKDLSTMQYCAKILRHIYAYIDGQDSAEDSKVSHLGHALADLMIMIDAKKYETLLDDRPYKGKDNDNS